MGSSVARAMLIPITLLLAMAIPLTLLPSDTVPTDIQAPGTQPGEVGAFTSPDNCDNCHGGTVNPNYEPNFGWRGSMMGNATRDPIFWATLAVAEQDFTPHADPNQRGGAGDLCLRCHSVNGWISGRSTPTDGSGLSSSNDINGVECEFCHLMVDPDQPVSISGTTEVQNPPFEAFDPTTGVGYRGAAEYVLNGNGTRLGPYSDANAKHPFIMSPFHRKSELCATCHDVSNPAVGDLAPNHGAQQPLDPGTFSGTLGSPVGLKAAFNNPPYKFGVVERTYSEWKSSAYPSWEVNQFPSLPAELKVSGGSLNTAYHRAYDARSNANYENGAVRTFTCQTCHMSASTGIGCNKPNTPTRTDLPRHDLTGSGYWMPDVIQYMDNQNTLRLGGGLSEAQILALNAGKIRAQQLLQSSASLQAWQSGDSITVKTVNLTGHKLISGYPEGRRMWIQVKWYDGIGTLIQEDGAYGPIGRNVTDLGGTPHAVESILNPSSTVVFEAHGGMDQAWASKLVNTYGYTPNLVLSYNRMDDTTVHTLGQLASAAAGTAYETFHFVLNNTVIADNRIPPYQFSYDEARLRNALPVPETQYGNPGAGGIYQHWYEHSYSIPSGAASAQVRLLYQQTSWEYIQFLWLQNDGLNTFLGNEGVNMLDGWLNTGMSLPLEIGSVSLSGFVPATPGAPGPMQATYNQSTGEIEVTYGSACSSSGHTVYYGDLSTVNAYNYSGAAPDCTGSDGSISFTPPAGSIFFVIAGNNGVVEGSYGLDSLGFERPEASGIGSCDYPQDLTNSCNSP